MGALVDNGSDVPGTFDKPQYGARPGSAFLALALVMSIGCIAAAPASAAPIPTRFVYASGEIVPIPASIPHEEGDMVDRRIVANLRWLAQRYPIYVTDGYSGKLPNGEQIGCRGCHVKHSDHYNGLAVDIVPLNGSGRCDAAWRGITRLARWAEPVQNRPRGPFRWVGYDGDAGHGCGHHLHLSWEHAAAPMFELAEWVEVFPVRNQAVAQQPEPRPRGGVSVAQVGGIGAGD
jgi:hypothetical protein